jgi:prepilin-type N-terminal cleavage/methylation domain-containing protein
MMPFIWFQEKSMVRIPDSFCNKVKGFTLIEVVIVITIIGILLAIGTLNFNAWVKKYTIEAQVREMASDLSDARLMAIKMKQRHLVTLNTSGYTFRSYSSEGDAAGIEVFNKRLKYEIKKSDGTSIAGTTFFISDRGFVESINPPTIAVGLGLGSFALDCIVISAGRVNTGKLNGTTCEFK